MENVDIPYNGYLFGRRRRIMDIVDRAYNLGIDVCVNENRVHIVRVDRAPDWVVRDLECKKDDIFYLTKWELEEVLEDLESVRRRLS